MKLKQIEQIDGSAASLLEEVFNATDDPEVDTDGGLSDDVDSVDTGIDGAAMVSSDVTSTSDCSLFRGNASVDELFRRLNAYQLAVVNHGEGMSCVIGVAGSGKSTTLVLRIARLVQDGVDPSCIMAMTFTRAAAAELNRRLVGLGVSGVKVGTIHSFCLAFLAAETTLCRSIKLDTKNAMELELKKLVNSFIRGGRIPKSGFSFGSLIRFIGDCKANGICFVYGDPFLLNAESANWLRACATKWRYSVGAPIDVLVSLYVELERIRFEKGLYNFDDMLLWAWMKLLVDPEVRLRWRCKWSVVIVDETQDSNSIQWDIARFLVGLDSCIAGISKVHMYGADANMLLPRTDSGSHNLMVAGDPSQSIYGWRGGRPSVFVDYWRSDAVTGYVLPLNYRSWKYICDVATELVIGKSWHLGGRMESARGLEITDGSCGSCGIGHINLTEYANAYEEAREIVQACAKAVEAKDVRLSDCAVLARMGASLELIELECINRRIPFVKRAAGSFVTNIEVKTLFGYIRVAAGLDPDGSYLQYIINRPFRYIPAAFVHTCMREIKKDKDAIDSDYTVLDIMKGIAENYKLRSGPRKSLNAFFKLMADVRNMLLACAEENISLGSVLVHIVRETDYIACIDRDSGVDSLDDSRVATIQILYGLANRFTSYILMLDYMDKLELATKQAGKTGIRKSESASKSGGNDAVDALTLSTIHRAKGLEWKHVFVVDVVQGRFPNVRTHDVDEELRLMYVAMTRAADVCSVSWANQGKGSVLSTYVDNIKKIMEKLT